MNIYPTQNRDDIWEVSRIDERLFFAVDIGAGAHKTCALGCDVRKVSDVNCDARYLPFKSGSFTIAVLRHTLEHIREWQQALAEAERVADFVFIFHPHLKTWHLDRSHIPFFVLPSRYVYLRTFRMSDLLFYSKLTSKG